MFLKSKLLKASATNARQRQKGAAALEFAILGPVFLGLMLSICEIGWVNFAASVTARANNEAARLLRTGQIQSIDTSVNADAQQQAVFDALCSYATIFGNCNDTITVEVETFATFADLVAADTPIICRDSAQDLQDNLNFDPGGDSAIVRIRTCILYNTLNPVIGLNLTRSNGSPNKLISQFLFRVEPFERNIL